MESAFCRYRLASRGARAGSTSSTGRRCAGDTTKWYALSCFNASSPMRTVPRVNARASVNGGKVTDAGAPGGTVIVCVSTVRPSTSRRTCTLLTAAAPRLTMLAATVTRSCPEKTDRCGRTVDTARFAVCASVIGTGLNVVPSGSRRFSSRTQPLRWKSLIMTTSRVCSVESASMRCASFSAGP